MKTCFKIIPFRFLPFTVKEMRHKGSSTIVMTNGCFDILHRGHVSYLETARSAGTSLIVGINSDRAVKLLKGPGRPVNNENDRAFVLAALECVSVVTVFDDVKAVDLLAAAKPDVWVKGGDYTLETLNQEEADVVRGYGGAIMIAEMISNYSTTQLLSSLKS